VLAAFGDIDSGSGKESTCDYPLSFDDRMGMAGEALIHTPRSLYKYQLQLRYNYRALMLPPLPFLSFPSLTLHDMREHLPNAGLDMDNVSCEIFAPSRVGDLRPVRPRKSSWA